MKKIAFYHLLGVIYSEEKNYEKAIKFFKESLAIKETSEGHFYLGVVYDKLGEKKKMEEEMNKSINLNPKNKLALNFLGYSYLLANKNIKQAYKMIREACRMEPENNAFLDSLGWAYYKMKQYKSAEKYLKKAASFEKDPEIFNHLGYLYFKIKNYQEAIVWWAKSLELKKNTKIDKMLQEAKSLLKGSE